MMHNKGFALLEIIVALLLGSLISGILFQSLSQSNQIFSKVTATSSIERRMALFQQQVETDFSGICAPPEPTVKKEDAQKDGQKEEKKETVDKKDEQKEDEKVLKAFTLESDGKGGIEILSFVTANPLPTYRQGFPRVVRVAYRVIPDTENEGKFLLVRQQSEELSLESFQQASKGATKKEGQKPIRSFEMIRNIHAITCTPFVELIKLPEAKNKKKEDQDKEEEKQKAEAKKEGSEEKKVRTFMTTQEWFALSQDERKKYKTPLYPLFLKIEITPADDLKKTRTFEFWFAAAGGFGLFEREGASELPSKDELQQRATADKETRRIHLHDGIYQP